MGILPYLEAPEQSIEMTSQFGGYNHRVSIGDGEFYDMKNMSAKDFPLASVRAQRSDLKVGDLGYIDKAQGIVAKDKLIVPFVTIGGTGVTIKEDVPALDPNVPGIKIGNHWYSQISYSKDQHVRDLIDLALSENFSNGQEIVPISKCVFSYGFEAKDILKVNSIDTFYLHKDSILLKIPHNGVSSICKFGVPVCYTAYSMGITDTQNEYTVRVYAGYVESRKFPQIVQGQQVYIGTSSNESFYVARIAEVGDEYYERDRAKREIKFVLDRPNNPFVSQPKQLPSNSYIVMPITPQFSNYVGVTNVKDYLYTDVKVDADKKSDLVALVGQKATFGGQEVDVVYANYDENDSYITIARPHNALTKGATAKGERLCFAEINTEDGSYIESNICQAAQGKRFLLEMGGNIVVFPEKVVVNTLERDTGGKFVNIQFMERENVLRSNFSYQLCDVAGHTYSKWSISGTAPTSPSNGSAWIDTSKEVPELKVWSSQVSYWATTQAYCQFTSEHISEEWEVGDAIEIEFSESTPNNLAPAKDQKYFVISEVGEVTEGDVKKRFIRFPAAMKDAAKFDAEDSDIYSVKFKRTIPELDFAIECKNRIWGCKYGLDEDGKVINEIFASKLGDAKNWHHFTNTAMDSYYVSMGDDGEFTGACVYKSNPMFFREDCFHTIFGDYPASYGLQTVHGHGLEKGSDKGVTVMNGVVFYKSPVGIMAYTGATPVNISEGFGYDKYKNAISKSLGSKMYYSLEDKNGKRTLFVFDDNTKLWHKEDDLDVKDFAVYEGEVYSLLEDGKILALNGANGKKEGSFEWMLESGNIGYNAPFHKRITKINLKMSMELDATASVYIQYDSDGNWHHISNIRPYGKVKSIAIPIVPHRCEHFAYKIEGKGDCKIISITKYMEDGSDAD